MDDMENETETMRLKKIQDGRSHSARSIEIIDPNYDPHLHRVVENPTTNFETLVHLLKCSLGTGILAMPQAFARSGLVTGIIATIVIGVMLTHCLHVLVRAQYALCKLRRVPLLTYPESMVAALEIGPKCLRGFARHSAIVVDVFLVVYQLGICCVYTVFIAATFKKIVEQITGTESFSVSIWMLIVLAPLIAANCIRNLKALAPFSSLANILTLIGLVIIVYYLFATDKKTNDPIDLWGSVATFPLFFGTTLFALTAVGVVIALENNMKTPKDFGKPLGVLNIGMTFIVLLYVAIGVIGYNFCRSKCEDSITLDISGMWESLSVQLMYAIAILISYVLQCYVPVEILWKTYIKPRLEIKGVVNLLRWEYGLRIILCLLTFVLAVSVPQLGLFISLFGALCLSALGMIFPAFMQICTCLPDKFGTCKYILFKDIILFLVGLVGMIAGTYATVLEIVRSFETKPEALNAVIMNTTTSH
ncbi:hypothetical protein O0L34_g2858 [Tuta absoluta]|nr:hypothetical protein O0L34_g2858 [Tuta absoluta]